MDQAEPGLEKSGTVTKRRWPLWKILAITATILLAVIALAVGLGVGLTQKHNHDGVDDPDGGDSSGDDGDDPTNNPSNGPNRTATWRPKVNSSWQIVLQNSVDIGNGTSDPDVDVWDLDLFDNDFGTFKALQDAGKKVICYFSAGSYENFRPDKGKFNQSDLGKGLDGWPGERWLNISSPNVRSIMAARIKLAWSKGCDAIDPDNVDGYQNDNGLGLTKQDSIDYMKYLHQVAESYHMAIGLKNAGDIILDVLDVVDFSVNEQCVAFSECETFSAFVNASKPVFHIEYPKSAPKITAADLGKFCSDSGDGAGSENFSTVLKTMDLNGFVEYCDGRSFTTAVDE